MCEALADGRSRGGLLHRVLMSAVRAGAGGCALLTMSAMTGKHERKPWYKRLFGRRAKLPEPHQFPPNPYPEPNPFPRPIPDPYPEP